MRDAGEDAWLGKEAPHDPVLDGPLNSDDGPLLALPPPTDIKHVDSSNGTVGFGAHTHSTLLQMQEFVGNLHRAANVPW